MSRYTQVKSINNKKDLKKKEPTTRMEMSDGSNAGRMADCITHVTYIDQYFGIINSMTQLYGGGHFFLLLFSFYLICDPIQMRRR